MTWVSTAKQRHTRLKSLCAMLSVVQDDVKQVCFLERSIILYWLSDGQVWVQLMPVLSECIVSTVKIGGEGIMMWAVFGLFGLSPLVPKGNLNATVYHIISHDSVIPTLWRQVSLSSLYFLRCTPHNCNIIPFSLLMFPVSPKNIKGKWNDIFINHI